MGKGPKGKAKGGNKNEGKRAMKGESDSEDEDGAAAAARSGGKMAVMEQIAAAGRARDEFEPGPDGAVEVVKGAPFKNKQRLLVIASRGITHRFRHLMNDVMKLLPHSTKDAKMESKDRPSVINEICELRGCNAALYFEARKHKDLYLWVARTPQGPSAKFLVQNIHTAAELKFTGNHLMFSRPFLVFDAAFDSEPHLQLIKEMFMQAFGCPKGHRRSKPFMDHTLSFYVLDGRIWVRNYQIAKAESTGETALVEVGPRFCLQLHRIFAGAFQGSTLYSNASYISPNTVRSREKLAKSEKYAARHNAQKEAVARKQNMPVVQDPFEKVFK